MFDEVVYHNIGSFLDEYTRAKAYFVMCKASHYCLDSKLMYLAGGMKKPPCNMHKFMLFLAENYPTDAFRSAIMYERIYIDVRKLYHDTCLIGYFQAANQIIDLGLVNYDMLINTIKDIVCKTNYVISNVIPYVDYHFRLISGNILLDVYEILKKSMPHSIDVQVLVAAGMFDKCIVACIDSAYEEYDVGMMLMLDVRKNELQRLK